MSTTPKMGSFEELAKYALQRAEKSCKRNDPIAWAYWISTGRWARTMSRLSSERSTLEIATEIIKDTAKQITFDEAHNHPRNVAHIYSRLKWCIAILRANGVRPQPLSLDWMRQTMKQESGQILWTQQT